MQTSRAAALVPLLVAVLAMMLGCGNGLPGIVRTVVGTEHVCTCASGGSHSSCPVCNPSLHEARSRTPTLEGVPCGEGRFAVGAGPDVAVIPATCAVSVALVSGTYPFPGSSGTPPDQFVQPSTPPPRFTLSV
jgi:hypothetical protein